MKTHFPLLALLFFILTINTHAQQWNEPVNVLKGVIIDSLDKTAIPGAVVRIISIRDTSFKKMMLTNENGFFTFDKLRKGPYLLEAISMGFSPFSRRVLLRDTLLDLGAIALAPSVKELQGVTIEGVTQRAEQKGDTTSFNANAFKTNEDATVEDLVKKMPGFTSEGGTLKVNGEEVRQVFLDGKPFFGEDPAAAMKNLPAEIVDRIQVFDRMSDQSIFTGIADGNLRKTINITTRPGRANGTFGRVYAGAGTDSRYNAGATINIFEGKRRITILGLANNINQQNFAADDLFGNIGSGGRFGGRMGMRGGSGRWGRTPEQENLMVGQLGGISATQSLGVNYSDSWGKKIQTTGSAFINHTNNENISVLNRNFLAANAPGSLYNESNARYYAAENYRMNLRMEYNMDSMNAFIFTPYLRVQGANTDATVNGQTLNREGIFVSETNNQNINKNSGVSTGGNLLYNKRLNSKGRTLSVNTGFDYNDQFTKGILFSGNIFGQGDTSIIDQQSRQTVSGQTLNTGIVYTEKLTQNLALSFNYSPSFTRNNNVKRTFNANGEGLYNLIDTLLTNDFKNDYNVQKGGATISTKAGIWDINIGADVQEARLSGTQFFPQAAPVNRYFTNILPNAMAFFRKENGASARIFYRAVTQAPTVNQLQEVVDNRNPLLLTGGNKNLKQSVNHNILLRYGKVNVETSHGIFMFMRLGFTEDYIANANFIAEKDTILSDGTLLNRGSQLSTPINLSGFRNVRGFFTYSFPVKNLKSTLSFNSSINYNRIPGLINNKLNLADNYTFSQGLNIGSNISQLIDFNLNYMGNYNIVQNSVQTGANNNFFNHTLEARVNLQTKSGLVFNTALANTLFSGLGAGFDQNFVLWNAGAGYKFFKDRSLDMRLSVFDLLKQNNSVNRNITETYIEDSNTRVLQRYIMLTATYTIRKFKTKGAEPGTDNTPTQGRPQWGGSNLPLSPMGR